MYNITAISNNVIIKEFFSILSTTLFIVNSERLGLSPKRNMSTKFHCDPCSVVPEIS